MVSLVSTEHQSLQAVSPIPPNYLTVFGKWDLGRYVLHLSCQNLRESRAFATAIHYRGECQFRILWNDSLEELTPERIKQGFSDNPPKFQVRFVHKGTTFEAHIRRTPRAYVWKDTAAVHDELSRELITRNNERLKHYVNWCLAGSKDIQIRRARFLLSEVEGSKYEENAGFNGPNALTILKVLGLSFERFNFKGAQLKGADLSQANVKEADFSEANLKDVIWDQANTRGAVFDNAKGFSCVQIEQIFFNSFKPKIRLFKYDMIDIGEIPDSFTIIGAGNSPSSLPRLLIPIDSPIEIMKGGFSLSFNTDRIIFVPECPQSTIDRQFEGKIRTVYYRLRSPEHANSRVSKFDFYRKCFIKITQEALHQEAIINITNSDFISSKRKKKADSQSKQAVSVTLKAKEDAQEISLVECTHLKVENFPELESVFPSVVNASKTTLRIFQLAESSINSTVLYYLVRAEDKAPPQKLEIVCLYNYPQAPLNLLEGICENNARLVELTAPIKLKNHKQQEAPLSDSYGIILKLPNDLVRLNLMHRQLTLNNRLALHLASLPKLESLVLSLKLEGDAFDPSLFEENSKSPLKNLTLKCENFKENDFEHILEFFPHLELFTLIDNVTPNPKTMGMLNARGIKFECLPAYNFPKY